MAFTAAEVEDGTGKSTALVYEQASAAAAWLTHAARGRASFNAASAGDQDKALLAATRLVEDWIRHRVDGVALVKDQALTFPRVGSTSRQGRVWLSDETPSPLLNAIRLMAEEEAGTGIVRHHTDADVEASSAPGASVKYRSHRGDVSARYPEAWAYASQLFIANRRKTAWAA